MRTRQPADIARQVASLLRRGEIICIVRDLISGIVVELPFRMVSSTLYVFRGYLQGMLRYLYVHVNERDKLGHHLYTGLPVYYVKGFWLTPRLFVGTSTPITVEDKVIQKLVETAGGYLGIRLENLATTDPNILAELYITVTNRILEEIKSRKVIELAPDIFYGFSTSPDELISAQLLNYSLQAQNVIDNVNELFQRASTLDKLIEETELQVKLEEKRTQRLQYIIIGAIIALAIVLTLGTGALQSLLSLSPVPTTVKATAAHKAATHVVAHKTVPAVKKTTPTKTPRNATKIVTPKNVTKVTRPSIKP